ncbi:MAG: cytochrome d ubiquinol oxidase subunit II [Ktedonobacteraceae bacterium]
MITMPYILLSIIWFALIAYTAFGGADFGAGFWDLIAFGPQAEEQHALIDHALGPVWETNHVWLIFLVVGLFSAFPVPFSLIVVVLFIPITLALFGTALRGSAFVFRTHGLREGRLRLWTRTFSISSILTPFCLGLAAAAVASGQIHVSQGVPVHTDMGSLWLTPFALTIGCMAVSLCATIAGVYLTVEASSSKKHHLAELFRMRTLVAGAVTSVLGALGLLLSITYAPLLWHGMLDHTIPIVVATMLIGLATAVSVYLRYYRLARIFVVAEAAFLLGSWGVSQIPYLIPPDITVDAGAATSATQLLLLIGIIIGMVIIIPSIYLLFYLLKLKSNMGLFQKGE